LAHRRLGGKRSLDVVGSWQALGDEARLQRHDRSARLERLAHFFGDAQEVRAGRSVHAPNLSGSVSAVDCAPMTVVAAAPAAEARSRAAATASAPGGHVGASDASSEASSRLTMRIRAPISAMASLAEAASAQPAKEPPATLTPSIAAA